MNYKVLRKATEYSCEKQNKMDNYTYLNENFCRQGQTVLIGDSITEIYNHTELFEKYRAESGMEVYNRGISGDTSDRLFERLYNNALNIRPKNMVLLIGTNDLGLGGDIFFTLSNVSDIIDTAKAECPDINLVLLAVYPVRGKQGRRDNGDILRLNARLKTLAAMKNVEFLDLTDKLGDGTGALSEDFTYDGLHLNVRGFELITHNLLPLL